MIFVINAATGLSSHIETLFNQREELQVTLDGYHFQTRIIKTSIYTDPSTNQVSMLVETGDLMPSGKNYKRNYAQERKTAKRRGETGAGSNSGDAKRHRARRKVAKAVGKSKIRGKDVHHKKSVKSGGGNSKSNLAVASRHRNRSHGGKIGNRKGKARK